MKRYLIFLIILIITGCGANKAPVVKVAHLYNNNNTAIYDITRHNKSYLYKSTDITEGANTHLGNILTRVAAAHKNAINATDAYNNGAVSFYQLEIALQQAFATNLEIFSALTAFMLSEGYRK